jgi:hypothetical protein
MIVVRQEQGSHRGLARRRAGGHAERAAMAGARRENLCVLALKFLTPAPRQRFDEAQVVSVARQLGSVRLLRGLSEAEQKALDTWLKELQ